MLIKKDYKLIILLLLLLAEKRQSWIGESIGAGTRGIGKQALEENGQVGGWEEVCLPSFDSF